MDDTSKGSLLVSVGGDFAFHSGTSCLTNSEARSAWSVEALERKSPSPGCLPARGARGRPRLASSSQYGLHSPLQKRSSCAIAFFLDPTRRRRSEERRVGKGWARPRQPAAPA